MCPGHQAELEVGIASGEMALEDGALSNRWHLPG